MTLDGKDAQTTQENYRSHSTLSEGCTNALCKFFVNVDSDDDVVEGVSVRQKQTSCQQRPPLVLLCTTPRFFKPSARSTIPESCVGLTSELTPLFVEGRQPRECKWQAEAPGLEMAIFCCPRTSLLMGAKIYTLAKDMSHYFSVSNPVVAPMKQAARS